MNSGPRQPRQSRGRESRARILERAREVLVNDGYDAIVMRQLAADLDMRLGNLQYYFATRDDLVAALIDAEMVEDRATFQRHAASADPLEALANAARDLLRRWRTDSGRVFAAMNFLRLHYPEIDTIYRRVYRSFYVELEALLARIDPDGDDTTHAMRARIITSVLDGALNQIDVGRREQFERTIIETVTQLATAPVRGDGADQSQR